MSKTSNRVVVGLSGGVDSSVTALLLKQQGFDVQAVFMKNWEENDISEPCSVKADFLDAMAVCNRLNISLKVVDFAKEYRRRVFEAFLQEHLSGRTPNPDILCNKEIKFKIFLEYALFLGAEFIATGHYAGKVTRGDQTFLVKSRDKNKDQTYFLYALNQYQLKKSLFPLEQLEKSEVRKIAERAGFQNHAKKDSTGICFIGKRKFKIFLQRYLPRNPGKIVDLSGRVIGRHEGLMYYTIGQRQGLTIGGRRDYEDKPWYVLEKNMMDNTLTVVQSNNNPLLYSKMLICSSMSWISETPPPTPLRCAAKIRYRQQEASCVIKQLEEAPEDCDDDDCYQVEFEEPQWAITPGQSIVFYQDEICLGGGIIALAKKSTE